MSKYTEIHLAAIRAAAEDSPLDLEKAKALAETGPFIEADISAKGVIAKARTMGVEYAPVQRLTKTGEKPIRKDEIVAQIEDLLGLENGKIKSIVKAGKQDLETLRDALKE